MLFCFIFLFKDILLVKFLAETGEIRYNMGMKALIVEDELKLVQSIQRGLKREGFVVDCCVDGKAAKEYIELNYPYLDIILLDIRLPILDGITLCRSLRAQKILTPILILTVKDLEEEIIEGLDAGADDYLTKPFSFDILLARIRALLRRPATTLREKIIAGPVTLISSERKVFCNNREIKLTPKEFYLLEYLMKHANEVITREEILENIWDRNHDIFSNIIDVHVNSIRQKLKKEQYAEILETVRGIGYRVKE